MFIDSHCHLDASEFGDAASVVAEQARAADVSWIIVPAVERANFDKVASLSATIPACVYALGIHPMYVPEASEGDLAILRERVQRAIDDDHFVAVGAIGLDFFIPDLTTAPMRAKQCSNTCAASRWRVVLRMPSTAASNKRRRLYRSALCSGLGVP